MERDGTEGTQKHTSIESSTIVVLGLVASCAGRKGGPLRAQDEVREEELHARKEDRNRAEAFHTFEHRIRSSAQAYVRELLRIRRRRYGHDDKMIISI